MSPSWKICAESGEFFDRDESLLHVVLRFGNGIDFDGRINHESTETDLIVAHAVDCLLVVSDQPVEGLQRLYGQARDVECEKAVAHWCVPDLTSVDGYIRDSCDGGMHAILFHKANVFKPFLDGPLMDRVLELLMTGVGVGGPSDDLL